MEKSEKLNYHESVQDYYGKQLKTSKDLQTVTCCAGAAPDHVSKWLSKIPEPVLSKFYGCGSPLPLGIDGLSVLDLGCGAGRDCYIAAAMVGKQGRVRGIDMTEEQLAVARGNVPQFATNLGYEPNLTFVKGNIENLEAAGIEASSVDICISNCVVNLSPDKEAVLKSVYSVLKEGGEFYFSDIYVDRRLDDSVKNDQLLVCECLGGALYINDFLELCASVGFKDPRVAKVKVMATKNVSAEKTKGAMFYSILFRLFKLQGQSTTREKYGDSAEYIGNIEGVTGEYSLDLDCAFGRERKTVDANTMNILSTSWLSKYFTVHQPDPRVHLGPYKTCKPLTVGLTNIVAKGDVAGVQGECGAGSCCK